MAETTDDGGRKYQATNGESRVPKVWHEANQDRRVLGKFLFPRANLIDCFTRRQLPAGEAISRILLAISVVMLVG